MAYHDAHAAHASDLLHRVFWGIKSFFAICGNAMISASAANRRLQTVERLNRKSDAELAALGIRREDIVRHVFIDMLNL
ncbi:MAG: DUF1127 domain-containing protein [Pseudomonadota bacterium]